MSSYRLVVTIATGVAITSTTSMADPLFTSWQTVRSNQYAKVREVVGGTPVQTWPTAGYPNLGGGQATPAFGDVQMIRYSANNIYVNSNNLATQLMGPWYNDAAKTSLFGRWPSSTPQQFRFPRNPQPASTHTATGGDVAFMVNGVVAFNYGDAFSYQNSTGQEQMAPTGDGIWNRLAYPVEGVTFDPSGAHQPGNGTYHWHSNPIGLRYQLFDNVSYTTATDTYAEDTSNLHHSPILGWAYDGYPIYGPYGFSTANNSSSGIRRMVSGFVLRNGSNGTTNLPSTGRTTLPAWAASAQNRSATLAPNQQGPAVSGTRPLGRYAEDYDHLADHSITTGYDLDRYNGRTCVTPEYPGGTYAYFVTIDNSGVAAFPNMVGGQFYGVASGGHAMTIGESTTTYFPPPAAVNDWNNY